MIPSTNTVLKAGTKLQKKPSLNYMMHLDNKMIIGNADKQLAMKQVIYKILNTERYQYIIYSWNYGIELKDLFGMPVSYVCCEVQDRIKEALTQDDRINDVIDFDYSFPAKGVIHVSFTVKTIFGDVPAERMVEF